MGARTDWWLVAVVATSACGGGDEVPQTETACADMVDDDDDGATDCADSDCAADPACVAAVEQCTGGNDEDGDSYVDCDDDDCWLDPACYQVDDPTDLPGPDGDPSLDIDKIRATLVGGTATFFATFDGAWPPSTSFYSWVIYFEIDNDGNTPVAAVTLQRVDGVENTLYTGVSANDVTLRQTPVGVYARIANVPSIGEKYYIESRIQKVNPGTRVTDTVVDAPGPLP